MVVGELLVQNFRMDGLEYEVHGVGLPNMVLGGRCEVRCLGCCGFSVDGSSVSPEPDGEVLRDGRPSKGGFGCVPRWGVKREGEGEETLDLRSRSQLLENLLGEGM